MANFKYMNMNSYPVRLPHKRGGSQEFAPGAGTNDEWFSRFCGKSGMLTKMSTEIQKEKVEPVRVNPFKPIAATFEDKGHYVTSSTGIHRCKHCDSYQTGSEKSMQIHLAMAHKLDPEVKEEIIVVPQLEVKPEEVTDDTEIIQEDKPVIEETVDENVFVCDICGKKFGTERGLNLHKSKAHK